MAEVFEGHHIGEQVAIRPERRLHDQPGLFHLHPALIPLLSLVTLISVEVDDAQGRPWHHDITAGALQVEDVYLLHYDHGVPYMAMYKVHFN